MSGEAALQPEAAYQYPPLAQTAAGIKMKLICHNGEGDIETLKAQYREQIEKPSDAWNAQARLRAQEMIRLLDRIEVEIPEQATWYYTTHHILYLTFNIFPDYKRRPVSIYATGDGLTVAKANRLPKEDAGCFHIEYLIPADQSPWPGAEISMRASSVSDALNALRIAFDRCAK